MKKLDEGPSVFKDSKTDLGYGRLGNPIHADYLENSAFPYPDEDENQDLPDEQTEIQYKVAKKTIAPSSFDSIPSRDKSKFHSVIKISEIASGLSPMPDLYKNRDAHIGGGKSTISHHAHGFSTSSQPSGHNYDREPIEDDADEHIYNLEDLATKSLREYISLIIMDIL